MTLELVPPIQPEEEALRFGRLRLFSKSAAHFKENYRAVTDAMNVGTAAHSLILGGRPVVGYLAGKQRRGKEFDAWLADQSPDAIVLSAKEFDAANRMLASVQANGEAMRCLDGLRETTRRWVDPMLGPCRGTPDVDGWKFITELKSGETSDPRKFKWKVIEFAYHGALSWYRDGIELAGLGEREACYIVAVEQVPPCACTVFRIGEETLEQGRKLIRTWSEQLKACRESDQWPAYSQSIVDLDLPDNDIGMEFGEGEDE